MRVLKMARRPLRGVNMSKRYVIQVFVTNEDNATLNAWENVQHPQGGDWLTRSSKTALADAAKLVQAGETRELRIAVSKPVYSVTPLDVEQGGYEAIKNVAAAIYNDF